MKTWQAITVSFGGCFVIVVLTAVVGGWLFWRSSGAKLMEGGKTAVIQGQAEGKATTEEGCMTAALDRRRRSDLGFSVAITQNLRFLGCLETSSPSEAPCKGVPDESSLMQQASWIAMRCRENGFNDSFCSSFFQQVVQYCSSPARRKKLGQ